MPQNRFDLFIEEKSAIFMIADDAPQKKANWKDELL